MVDIYINLPFMVLERPSPRTGAYVNSGGVKMGTVHPIKANTGVCVCLRVDVRATRRLASTGCSLLNERVCECPCPCCLQVPN